MEIYVIYKKPSDYPEKYVARRFENIKPTNLYIVADSFQELMENVPSGKTLINRFPDDDSVIMGVLI